MAVFPSITPNSRELGFGNFPQLSHSSASGISVRFLQSSTRRVDQRLVLEFVGLTESQATSITDHYAGQQGTLISFTLPSNIWAGFDSVPISASEYQWRYAGPYSLEQSPVPGRFNISLTLVSDVI